jgi:hypothetical protein
MDSRIGAEKLAGIVLAPIRRVLAQAAIALINAGCC